MVKRSLLLSFCLPGSLVVAWGPLFEPLKGGSGQRMTPLKASEREDEHEAVLFYRANLERTFALEFPVSTLGLSDTAAATSDIPAPEGCVLDDIMGNNNIMALDSDSAQEEDCPIPDDFKAFRGDVALDVLNFLGIRRVEPLRVNGRTREWE